MFQDLLMIPGPTNLPPEVLQALSKPLIGHRSKEFSLIFSEVISQIKEIVNTNEGRVFLFSSSGTGGLEALFLNAIDENSKLLIIDTGIFGQRLVKLAETFNIMNFDIYKIEYGKSLNLNRLARILKESRYDFVFFTHNETSTGVLNPLPEICKIIREESPDTFILTDGISSIGSVFIDFDKNSLDAIVGASQKGLISPPGVSFVVLSERLYKRVKNRRVKSLYFNFSLYQQFIDIYQTPFTPAISTIFALHEALKLIKKEGLTNVVQRHNRLAYSLRQALKTLSFTLFAQDEFFSPVVTAVNIPENLDINTLLDIMKNKYKIILGKGHGFLKDKIFRIGHLGIVSDKDILYTFYSLVNSLIDMSFIDKEKGFKAVQTLSLILSKKI